MNIENNIIYYKNILFNYFIMDNYSDNWDKYSDNGDGYENDNDTIYYP